MIIKQLSLQNNDFREIINFNKLSFSEIRKKKEFKILLKEENKINHNFHGNSDLFNLIKGFILEVGRLSTSDQIDVTDIIEKYIERNFGGINYEIDIDFNIHFSDEKYNINIIKKIFEDFIPINNIKRIKRSRQKNLGNKDKKDEIIKISQVFLFKKLYNIECGKETQSQIGNENCKKYDLNKCINDNINDNNNSRFLLLGIKPSLSSLIYNIIEIQNPEKTIDIYDGSPFIEDNSNEYKFKKFNEIKDDSKNEKLIILQNLNQIQSFLYNLYSMNYIKKMNRNFLKYIWIALGK